MTTIFLAGLSLKCRRFMRWVSWILICSTKSEKLWTTPIFQCHWSFSTRSNCKPIATKSIFETFAQSSSSMKTISRTWRFRGTSSRYISPTISSCCLVVSKDTPASRVHDVSVLMREAGSIDFKIWTSGDNILRFVLTKDGKMNNSKTLYMP